MKRLLSILLFLWQVSFLFALDVPYLSGRIVDEVGILPQRVVLNLEEKLANHEKQTSNQIAVLIIPSLEGEVLEEYSLKVASTWKLGQKDKNNGVLLLIAKEDRKIRIEVGYGLEGNLTDVKCNRIIRNKITPHFKNNDFPLGVEKGIDAIIYVLAGDDSEPPLDVPINNVINSEEFGMYENFANSIISDDIPLFFRIAFGLLFLVVITPFTIMTAVIPYMGWFLYFFLMPFYATFPLVALGYWGKFLLPIYIVLMFFVKIYFGFTKSGQEKAKKFNAHTAGSSGGWSSGRSSGGGGGFSGGGGSFGGGGSSGSW